MLPYLVIVLLYDEDEVVKYDDGGDCDAEIEPNLRHVLNEEEDKALEHGQAHRQGDPHHVRPEKPHAVL